MSYENENLVKHELRQGSNENQMMSVLQQLRIELMNEQRRLIEIYQGNDHFHASFHDISSSKTPQALHPASLDHRRRLSS